MEGGNALSLLLPVALFIIMLGMGLTLQVTAFSQLWHRPKPIVAGLILQLIMLPVLTFILVTATKLPGLLAVGLLIVSFAPGGATSNMISHLCRADTALSIALTSLSSLIVPFTLPWLTWLSMKYFLGEGVMVELPLLITIMKLVIVTLVPVAVGMIVNHIWPEVCRRIERPVKVLSLVFMFTVVVLISWANRAVLPELIPVLGPVVLMMVSSAIALSVFVSRYLLRQSTETSLTLGIETGIQNAGTGLLVTGALLQQPEMSLAVLLYGILMQLPIVALILWRNSAHSLKAVSINAK
ncbi:bile acid:sodium symporter family protein [Amphritea japonica]|uniref:Bile acid:Na+ symporter, BASS family n=1 Tax=Amphritea japonica ATCC BAA-1530 TaxID=1278309 RepID=A0A7R6PH94_9GAMM|nr:bile acid:sodium symporter family protein [Amphritea japonica]BBB26457.1 bile acid:Na+ symporter, BASS family [Amphritea japonica ATCC BAA-1530]